MTAPLYKHRRSGFLWVFFFVLGLFVVTLSFTILGTSGSLGIFLSLLFVGLWLMYCATCFRWLQVIGTDDSLEIRFGPMNWPWMCWCPFVNGVRLSLSDISSFDVIDYDRCTCPGISYGKSNNNGDQDDDDRENMITFAHGAPSCMDGVHVYDKHKVVVLTLNRSVMMCAKASVVRVATSDAYKFQSYLVSRGLVCNSSTLSNDERAGAPLVIAAAPVTRVGIGVGSVPVPGPTVQVIGGDYGAGDEGEREEGVGADTLLEKPEAEGNGRIRLGSEGVPVTEGAAGSTKHYT